ncbi:hypothetical protein D6833_11350 [Candidatus Parcubacteria bacterium]|nr:MAG: hypothetical protein D6833_11350 [Candidatus Parcubacteria bacterium]
MYIDQFPKYANTLAVSVFRRLRDCGECMINEVLARPETCFFVFYQEATQYWVKATVRLPYYARNGKVGAPAHDRYLYHADEDTGHWTCALMHSSLFFVYFVTYSDCFHLSDGLARGFPVPKSLIGKLMKLCRNQMELLRRGVERKLIHTRAGDKIAYDEYYGWQAKPSIDQIDVLLAKHYGFSDEELDVIVNYDIEYRMGVLDAYESPLKVAMMRRASDAKQR